MSDTLGDVSILGNAGLPANVTAGASAFGSRTQKQRETSKAIVSAFGPAPPPARGGGRPPIGKPRER